MILYIFKYFMFGYKQLTSEENLDHVYVKMENVKSGKNVSGYCRPIHLTLLNVNFLFSNTVYLKYIVGSLEYTLHNIYIILMHVTKNT